ncbi:glutathione S-transferase family protein [Rhizomicrobium electricum]|uniref:Glutathione S-transferase n=1 Tax=Rhizomicrobium electricum TaxID=480070 RepID=A0ABN1F790_9PROT|nr:glutathione S-transferase [Rhizomicrobium electricum]NIJ46669.1 glutathione S-transferase [Rhizomicrobium electricum]
MIALCGFAVSNYYNKLKLVLLEKTIPFEERLVYPWQRSAFRSASPLGKIPYIETEHGCLSESQAILEYLEDTYPQTPLYPADTFARAKCRELIQHLEFNAEWVARRLYREAFFGGTVSDETKHDVHKQLAAGLKAIASLASFSPYILGPFSAADCVAYVHFSMIAKATVTIYGENMVEQHLPNTGAFMQHMEQRPHVAAVNADRAKALAAFQALKVKYSG